MKVGVGAEQAPNFVKLKTKYIRENFTGLSQLKY